MIYVFNKNKIFSYMIASFIVVMIFTFGTSIIPNTNIELVKVSANISENNNLNLENNF